MEPNNDGKWQGDWEINEAGRKDLSLYKICAIELQYWYKTALVIIKNIFSPEPEQSDYFHHHSRVYREPENKFYFLLNK